MNIMFTIPAATFTSIVSCRAFVSLSSFRSKDLYVHSRSQTHTPGAPASYGTTVIGSGGTRRGAKGGGVGDKLNVIAGVVFGGIDSMGGDLYEHHTQRGVNTTAGNISMDDLERSPNSVRGGGDKKYAFGDGDEEFVATRGGGDDEMQVQVDLERAGERDGDGEKGRSFVRM